MPRSIINLFNFYLKINLVFWDFKEGDNPELTNLCSRHWCLEEPSKTPKEFYDINI